MNSYAAYIQKIIILICCLFIICTELQSQNLTGPVGIGTNTPRELLHIKDGSMMIEGSNQYINFITKSPHTTGLKFLNDEGGISGAWLYSSQDETINLSRDGQALGLVYDFRNNFALLGRTNQIGENEKFGVRINTPKPDFGGMNVETSGHKGSKPYYGYAVDGEQKAIHYYDGASKSWKLRLREDIMVVTSEGSVGIGTNSPKAKLHIHGSNSNLATSEGLLTLGGTNNRIAFGVSSSDHGQIYSKSNTGMLVLGGKTNDVLFIDGANKRVGINVIDPFSNNTFEIASEDIFAANVTNSRSGINTKVAARFTATSDGDGTKYGIQAFAHASDSQTREVYGGKLEGIGGQSSGSVYGVYAEAIGTGTGDKYGVFTRAETSDPSTNTKSWALYSSGNSYFSNEVLIGTKNGAIGYIMSVDGKIMCEDLKMQNSISWPDYVFDKDYNLKSLEEVEAFVKENGHLPNVPSAQEIEDNGGYEQGAMNQILLEKVEELTLYLIDQKKVQEKLTKKIIALEAKLQNQSKK